jgi:hypothetical protein
MKKFCKKCGVETERYSGPDRQCKPCYKAYYIRNRERILQRYREYRATHHEKLLEQKRTYYGANPEKMRAYRTKNRKEIAIKRLEYDKKYRAENRERIRERNRQYRATNLTKVRDRSRELSRIYRALDRKKFQDQDRKRRLRVDYGIDLETYNSMLAAQNGVCYVCRLPETRKARGVILPLAIDHCHKTGVVRKLLCQSCNTALGCVQEDTQRLRRMINYLEKGGQEGGEQNGAGI